MSFENAQAEPLPFVVRPSLEFVICCEGKRRSSRRNAEDVEAVVTCSQLLHPDIKAVLLIALPVASLKLLSNHLLQTPDSILRQNYSKYSYQPSSSPQKTLLQYVLDQESEDRHVGRTLLDVRARRGQYPRCPMGAATRLISEIGARTRASTGVRSSRSSIRI